MNVAWQFIARDISSRARIIPFPDGTVLRDGSSRAHSLAINCQATFIRSLWDKSNYQSPFTPGPRAGFSRPTTHFSRLTRSLDFPRQRGLCSLEGYQPRARGVADRVHAAHDVTQAF